MRRHWRLYALSLGCLIGVASNVLGQSPTFTSIDFPGASSTQAWGINSRGDIVGQYVNPDNSNHGFLLRGGQYQTIDFPGATSSGAFGISATGDIGGSYISAGVTHGFVQSGGKFTSIDAPGGVSTEVSAIDSRGEIVGDYSVTSATPCCAAGTHGFVLSGGNFTTMDFPDAILSLNGGINPGGDIAGSYSDGVSKGFLWSDGDFTSIAFPGATFTNALSMNARGDVVGRYTAGGVTHGYVLTGGQFYTIDFPGATFTGNTAINQRGDIVGRYRKADGVFHGFLLVGFRPPCVASMAAPQIAVTAGGAAVTHSSDFTLVTASKPAAPGEVLSIFASGLGPTRPGIAAGQPFPSNPAPVDSLVEVRVNGRSAVVFGAVGFPGAVDGYQVNFRVPPGTGKGLATVELSAAGVAGPPVNIMVQ